MAKEQASRTALAVSFPLFSLARVTNQGTHQLSSNRFLDPQADFHRDKHRKDHCDRLQLHLSKAHTVADYFASSIGFQAGNCRLKRRFGKDSSPLIAATRF